MIGGKYKYSKKKTQSLKKKRSRTKKRKSKSKLEGNTESKVQGKAQSKAKAKGKGKVNVPVISLNSFQNNNLKISNLKDLSKLKALEESHLEELIKTIEKDHKKETQQVHENG